MKSRTYRLWFGTLCALALAVQTGVRADDEKKEEAKPATLAVTTKVGETLRYKTILLLNIGAEVTVEQNRKQTVKEIKDNKEIVVLVEDEGGKFIANGAENEFPATSPVTMTLDKANKVLTYKPKVEDNPYLSATTLHLLALSERIIFTDKPVKPGDSWTTEVDNPQVKGKKVKIKTTFVGSDKVGDVAAWKVKQELEADTEVVDNKLKSETTALLDSATGYLLKAEQTVSGVPSQNGPVEWKGKIERVKPTEKKVEKTAGN